ncbi:hypothetical protein SAMN05444580_110132 [Rhodococcus tukisamuensis]|uniref:Uncharacterized protein n=1 Tax=Rhodococcus tukisamuensis TaxID=168276 RepID=A0A1G7ACF9_9NOCA|nr:hypothetical protein SAMN05444580_110132 [Rhodococcus tukisamuensis]
MTPRMIPQTPCDWLVYLVATLTGQPVVKGGGGS